MGLPERWPLLAIHCLSRPSKLPPPPTTSLTSGCASCSPARHCYCCVGIRKVSGARRSHVRFYKDPAIQAPEMQGLGIVHIFMLYLATAAHRQYDLRYFEPCRQSCVLRHGEVQSACQLSNVHGEQCHMAGMLPRRHNSGHSTQQDPFCKGASWRDYKAQNDLNKFGNQLKAKWSAWLSDVDFHWMASDWVTRCLFLHQPRLLARQTCRAS